MIRKPDFSVSTNFTFGEIFKSYEAERVGIDNGSFITEEILDRAVATAENILEPVRKWVRRPMTPNSWFRCEELEYFICCETFYNRLRRDGVEGVTSESHKYFPTIYLMPTEYADHWKAYFERKQHPKGQAVDFEIPGLSNQELFDWCRDQLRFDQLILEFHRPEKGLNSGWVHGSYNNEGPNRGEILRY